MNRKKAGVAAKKASVPRRKADALQKNAEKAKKKAAAQAKELRKLKTDMKGTEVTGKRVRKLRKLGS